CVCGKKIGPDPRNFNQRVSLGRNDLLIRTFPKLMSDKEINNRSDLKNFSKVFFKECLSSGKSEYENHLSEKEHALRYNY
ncbi:hypothetical protein ABQ433_24290, partial [Citrobacter freundii]